MIFLDGGLRQVPHTHFENEFRESNLKPLPPDAIILQINNSETLKGFPAAAEQSCCPPSVSVHFQVTTQK